MEILSTYNPTTGLFEDQNVALDLGMTYDHILTYRELLTASISDAKKVYNWNNVNTVVDER